MTNVRTLTVGEGNEEMTIALDELAREGARRMIAVALRAKADEYVERFSEEVDEDGHRLVVRNGPTTLEARHGATVIAIAAPDSESAQKQSSPSAPDRWIRCGCDARGSDLDSSATSHAPHDDVCGPTPRRYRCAPGPHTFGAGPEAEYRAGSSDAGAQAGVELARQR